MMVVFSWHFCMRQLINERILCVANPYGANPIFTLSENYSIISENLWLERRGKTKPLYTSGRIRRPASEPASLHQQLIDSES